MGTSIINSYTTPDSTGKPVVHEDLANLVKQMALGDIMFFANNAERAAKFAALTISPPVGAVSHRADIGVHERFNGTASPTVSTAWTMVTPYRSKQTLTGSAASVTFTVPSGMSRVRVSVTARSDAVAFFEAAKIRINGDSGNNYHYEFLQGNMAAVASLNANATSFIWGGWYPCASSPAGAFGSGWLEFAGWDAPHSTFLGCHGHAQAAAAQPGTNQIVATFGGTYTLAGPYLSLTILPGTGNWVTGSQFALEAWD